MIGMVGNHLLVKIKWSDNVQKNRNALALKPAISDFQKKCDDEVGFC